MGARGTFGAGECCKNIYETVVCLFFFFFFMMDDAIDKGEDTLSVNEERDRITVYAILESILSFLFIRLIQAQLLLSNFFTSSVFIFSYAGYTHRATISYQDYFHHLTDLRPVVFLVRSEKKKKTNQNVLSFLMSTI